MSQKSHPAPPELGQARTINIDLTQMTNLQEWLGKILDIFLPFVKKSYRIHNDKCITSNCSKKVQHYDIENESMADKRLKLGKNPSLVQQPYSKVIL